MPRQAGREGQVGSRETKEEEKGRGQSAAQKSHQQG